MNIDFKSILILAIIFICLIIVLKWLSKFKFPKVTCMCLVTGGLKSGKTTFALGLAYNEYKRELRYYKFHHIFNKNLEKPLFYSNIPLKIPHVRVTEDLLLRKVRLAYRSVCYLSEASLIADSMLYKDSNINTNLLLFCKLFGHETLGGKLIIDTQSCDDLHFAFRRSLSNYIYIHHLEKRIPFFLYAKVREERYSTNATNVYNSDLEDTLKKVLIRKKIWSIFDSYTYSESTDDLPVLKKEVISKSLKTKHIVTLNPTISFKEQTHEKKKL